MTLTELRYIVAVAREHHFGRAAKSCHVSQPTLSVAIKKLEAELGVAIFERGSNEISLSPIGERIVQQAQQTLEAADNIKQLALHGKNQLSRPLRIGAIHTIGPYLYPELIPLLHKAAPEMPLVVEENYTSVLTEKLKRGELDVIIIALPYEEQGIVSQALYEEPFVVLLPASHPLTSRKTINSKLLEAENVLLLGQGHCFRDHVLEACPACIPKPGLEGDLPHTVEGSSLETIRHMVVSGLGVTVLPCTAAGAHSYSQRLLAIRRFSNPIPTRTIALAWRVSFPRPKVINVINKAIRDCNLSCVKNIKKTR
ncbi:MAG: hydrogen peroxide-inducible genes activator [Gammaproteobacteria bacterium]|nr:MAG: hydrogen peroxide-inducible genes activator [Gammaproteobacteria bacterium]